MGRPNQRPASRQCPSNSCRQRRGVPRTGKPRATTPKRDLTGIMRPAERAERAAWWSTSGELPLPFPHRNTEPSARLITGPRF